MTQPEVLPTLNLDVLEVSFRNLARWKVIETPPRLDTVQRIIGFQRRLAESFAFADPRAQITIPSSRVTAVHYTRDEAQLLCRVAPVLPNVVSAGCGVLVHKFADIAGLGKDVGGVPQLRDFGDNRGAAVEDVFVAK